MEKSDDGEAIACSLNDAEFRERRALARQTLIPKITNCQRIPDGLTFTFPNSAVLRRDVEIFVSLERQCCSFLTFRLSPDEVKLNQPLVLTIKGTPEAAATIEMFVQAANEYSA